MTQIFSFESLSTADLVVDALYEGGLAGNASDDPIAKLLPGAGNQGGFRAAGPAGNRRFVVLYTSGKDGDWPDQLDLSTGQFIYYGDNKRPGHTLHDTSRGGNLLLQDSFDRLHRGGQARETIPPFFVFASAPNARSGRTVKFKGLAAPGFPGLSSTEDLVAVWKTTDGERFQNYRSVFTILDVAVVERVWIRALGTPEARSAAPATWYRWIQTGAYAPLTAERTTQIRSLAEQTPDTVLKRELLQRVWNHFKDSPTAFESFAARIYQMSDERVIVDEITRAVVDGGRDAVGRYRLGRQADPVYAEFSLEAKCYRPGSSTSHPTTVGVADVARLISRLRHRQFGVLVTTSAIARQAYEEVRGDRHPILFVCGRDIAEILIHSGHHSTDRVDELLLGWPNAS